MRAEADRPPGALRIQSPYDPEARFSKPCEFVGTATWGWEDERITHIALETDAYALSDRDSVGQHSKAYHNRPEDLAWATEKIAWLFRHAGIGCRRSELIYWQ